MFFKYTHVFLKERFPLYTALPFCLILFFVANKGIYLNRGAFTGLTIVFLALLLMRFADDYTDVDIDKIKAPERSLSNGAIPHKLVLREIAIISMALFALMLATVRAWPIYMIATIDYAIFLLPKRKIAVALHPWLDKMWFLLVPPYSQLMIQNKIDSLGWIWGAFFYLATVAHSYGHSIRSVKAGEYIPELGTDAPVVLAVSAVGLYLLSFGPAYLIMMKTRSIGFALTLLVTMIWLSILLIRLLMKPTEKNSRKIYVPGYLFFVFPSLAYLIEGIFKNILGG